MRSKAGVALCLGFVVAGLFLATGGTAAQDGSDVTVRLEPANGTIQEDDTARFAVVASGVDDGLSSFNVTITSDNATVAYVGDEEYGVQGSVRSRYRNYQRDARMIRIEDIDEDVGGEVTLAHVIVRGENPGSANLAIDAPALAAGDGTPYEVVETRGADLTVEMDRPGAEVQFGQADTLHHFDNVVGPGQRTYWDLSFYDLDDGLRNLTYEVSVDNPSVANVEDVTFPGSPAGLNVTRNPDSGVTRIEAHGLNLTDEQDPPVGSVVVNPSEPGETAISVDVVRATNASGDRYRITSQTGANVTVVPWQGSADVRIEPSDEQPDEGVAYDVVATNLTGGLSAYELHVTGLGQFTPDLDEFPTQDVRDGGMGIKPREGEVWFDVTEIESVTGSEVVLARLTLDDAPSTDAVNPRVRPIYVLDSDRHAYDVEYEPLRESGAASGGETGSGSGGDGNGDTAGGSGAISLSLVVVGIALGLAAAGARARRRR